MEKLARIYDAEIQPVWAEPFGRLLLADLSIPPGSQILDVACATGYPAIEILGRMGERSRLIAIDSSSALLDVARRKLQAVGAKSVFFRTESAIPRLSFADDVYDLVVCNLGLFDMPDMDRALVDFTRVAKIGAEVRCTLPLADTFAELYELFRQVLRAQGMAEALERLDWYLARYPTVETCEAWMHAAGLGEARVKRETFSLRFASARELFLAPVIDFGFLPQWKAIAGPGEELQDVFWALKEALDARADGQGLSLIVQAGCLVGRKERSVTTGSWPAESAPQRNERTELLADLDEYELEIDRAPEQPTAQLDVEDIEEIAPEDSTTEDTASIELDAIHDERARPSHLPPHGDEE